MSAPGSSSNTSVVVSSATPVSSLPPTSITSDTRVIPTTTPSATTPSIISTTPVITTPSTTPSLVSSSPSLSTTPSIATTTPNIVTTPSQITSVVTQSDAPPSTITTIITTGVTEPPSSSTSAPSAAATSSASAVGSAGDQGSSNKSAVPASTIAPAVIVPVVVIALLLVLGIFFWRRKQRRQAVELRQKEMEEYSFNPNSDPLIPAVGAVSTAGDESGTEGGGYRGWGTTSSGAARTLAPTTLGASSAVGAGAIGIARSDSSGHGYDGHYSPNGVSPERHPSAPASPEGLGALGAAPLASQNRSQGVNRGISNASSAYSGGQRSDGSDNINAGYAGSPQYYDDFMQPDEGYSSPVIRDVSARRNTQIESPGVFPQHGNAGIAQNF